MLLRGVFPVLATPFTRQGEIDTDALRRIVRFCLKCGVQGLVWPAVASEFYALSDDERKACTRVIIDEVAGEVPVIAGTSGCSTQLAVALTADALEAGASAVMLLPPYVVKDDHQGIRHYFEEVCRVAGSYPVILQNAPSPLGQGLSPSAVAGLVCETPGLMYVKEENTPSGHALSQIIDLAGPRLQGAFGGGGGRNIVDEHRRGACGAMPACEFSDVFVSLWDHLEAGRLDAARGLYERILPLLTMQATLRMAFTKEVLRRRGIIEFSAARIGAGIVLDDYDQTELDALMLRIADQLRL